MNYFANQHIQITPKKSISRTVIIRAQLQQLMTLKGLLATLKTGQEYPILRWGVCKKHSTNEYTRRVNVFQMYINGSPMWIAENMINDSQNLMKALFASATMGMYKIYYSHDFTNPLYQISVNVSKDENNVVAVQSVSPFESSEESYKTKVKTRRARRELKDMKVSKSPGLPSLKSFSGVNDENVVLPKLKF